MKKIYFIKSVIFVLCCIVIFMLANSVLKIEDRRAYQMIGGFYAERKNSLDAVYIGGSGVFSTWISPLAWHHYGITIWPFSSIDQSIVCAEYIIREARKTQKDALYIISINGLSHYPNNMSIHSLVDFMRLSKNKYDIIKRIAELRGLTFIEQIEFYFPIIRFHSRWNQLKLSDFDFSLDGVKGSSIYSQFIENISNTSYTICTNLRTNIQNSLRESVIHLMDFCKYEKINVLFVIPPQLTNNSSFCMTRNTIVDIIRTYGYPIIDIKSLFFEVGLNLSSDYYDAGHTNIHGAVKTTSFLAKYLVDNYGFQDKRSDPNYSDWDAAYEKYASIISPYALPFEYTDKEWNLSLAVPIISAKNGILSWQRVAGADGYGVFRKKANDPWLLVDTVGSDELSWQPKEGTMDMNDTFNVVAYTGTGKERRWGKLRVDGIRPVHDND